MITRREFLKGSVSTLILIPLAACSSDDGGSPTGTGGSSCQGVASTGSSSAGHTHSLCVPTSDLSNPPAGGRTYATSSNAGHTHGVTLSQAQLQSIASGNTVNVNSTGGGHVHNFAIKQA